MTTIVAAALVPAALAFVTFHAVAHRTRDNGRAGYIATLVALAGWLVAVAVYLVM